jgi:hypothetical protein
VLDKKFWSMRKSSWAVSAEIVQSKRTRPNINREILVVHNA